MKLKKLLSGKKNLISFKKLSIVTSILFFNNMLCINFVLDATWNSQIPAWVSHQNDQRIRRTS